MAREASGDRPAEDTAGNTTVRAESITALILKGRRTGRHTKLGNIRCEVRWTQARKYRVRPENRWPVWTSDGQRKGLRAGEAPR